jgi:hypothetical protein
MKLKLTTNFNKLRNINVVEIRSAPVESLHAYRQVEQQSHFNRRAHRDATTFWSNFIYAMIETVVQKKT